jgi:DNA-binding response OmpR family regulator
MDSATVLLADTDTETRNQLRQQLEHDGFTVLDAPCALSAVDISSNHRPDIIISSQYLSRLHCKDILELRAANQELSDIPVIAYGDPADATEDLFALRLDDFVSVPVDYRVLLLRLRMVLSRKRTRGVQGELAHFPLVELVQMLLAASRNGLLEIDCGSLQGYLAFKNGNVFHAATGKLTGEEAFLQILRHSAEGGKFAFDAGEITDLEENLTKPTNHILLGLANVIDEGK